MNNIQIIQNIIDDYKVEEENLENNIQYIQKELSKAYQARTRIRNNKAILYELLTNMTGDEYDMDLFEEEDLE